MFFPEGLYTLSSRDSQVTWLDPALRGTPSGIFAGGLSSNTVAVDGSVSEAVPSGRALLLQHVNCIFQPTGGFASSLRRILVRPPTAGSIEIWLDEQRSALAANVAAQAGWQGSLLIPSGWFVQGYGEFSGGAANELTLSYGGLYIPIGNIQRV